MNRVCPIISLLTDFGSQDYFVAVMKAVILGIVPSARIIDICHDIPAQDIRRAAFVLTCSYSYFPKGTIHLAVVDPGVGSSRRPILIKTKNYFFVGPDNGIFSLVLRQQSLVKVIHLSKERFFLTPISQNFHGRDIFAPVAAWLARGVAPEEFGPRLDSFTRLSFASPLVKKEKIIGEIIYIDHFGNLVTNIHKDLLDGFCQSAKDFRIIIRGKMVTGLVNSYSDLPKSKALAIIGSANYLEVAVNMGSAEKFFRAREGMKVEVWRR